VRAAIEPFETHYLIKQHFGPIGKPFDIARIFTPHCLLEVEAIALFSLHLLDPEDQPPFQLAFDILAETLDLYLRAADWMKDTELPFLF